MPSRLQARPTHSAQRSTRKGLSLIEVIVAIMILSIAMAFVGHISSGLAQYSRVNDVVAKRTFAMQQQANIIGAMSFANLTAAVLPATKTFTIDDFTYERRIALSTTGTTTSGQTTNLTIIIVPQTGVPSDTLLKESLSMVRTSPNCGTVLGTASC